MRSKFTVILISVILVLAFGMLIYLGIRHSRGIPVKVEKIERAVIEVPFIDKDIDLSGGIASQIWETIAPKDVKLMYQVTALPWPKLKGIISPVSLKAFHNGENIYFYFRWEDDTEDRILEMSQFSDACAIMFPKDEKAQPASIMMGFLGKVNIWQWKANQDREYWQSETRQTKAYVDFYYPFEEEELFPVSNSVFKSAVNDLLAIRVGTVTPKEGQNVSGRGLWKDGAWQVVFKRALKQVDLEEDAGFNPGRRLSALAVWNGSKGDRGGRKSISDWVELEIK